MKMNIDLNGVVFSDEPHADVGSAAFEILHDWFSEEDLVIRTAAAGGGTLLVIDTDYQLSEESVDDATKGVNGLSTRTAKTIFHKIQIINATYQTGNLYFSGKYFADSIDALDHPLGHLFGLTLSNSAGDPTNDIDIAAGEAVDNTYGHNMVLAAVLTKRLDAAWTVGSGQGGLDTGSIANTTYHVWLIKRTDTGVVDALFSLSATAPTMPTTYDRKRRIGMIYRLSAAIVLFVQDGDEFLQTPIAESSVSVSATSELTTTLANTPTGIKVRAILSVALTGVGSGTTYSVVYSPDQASIVPSSTQWDLWGNTTVNQATRLLVRTNTSAQIKHRHSQAVGTIRILNHGWLDTRGRTA